MVKEVVDLLSVAWSRLDLWRTVRVQAQPIIASTNLTSVSRARHSAAGRDDLGRLASEFVTAEALAAVLCSGNRVPGLRTSGCTHLRGVRVTVVDLDWKRANALIAPAALEGLVACIDSVISAGRVLDDVRIRVGVIAFLLAGAEIVGALAISVPVVDEQPRMSSLAREHCATIMASVNVVDGIAVPA